LYFKLTELYRTETSTKARISNFEENDITLENGSAVVVFAKDPDYSVKNAPLDLYVNYTISRDDVMNMISQENTIVGKEKAIKIEGRRMDTSRNIRFLDYLRLHNNEP
jgi:hypothetical protein